MTATVQPPLFGAQQEQLTSDDYYTPKWVFDAMGITFDLDVCAPPGGIPWIPADRYFTKADDGLAQPWEGRVWMNPPFSDPSRWIAKFIEHRHGVALVPMAASRWFRRLWDCDAPMTLYGEQDRAVFARNDGERGIPTRVALFAFGPECVEAISHLGVVRTVR